MRRLPALCTLKCSRASSSANLNAHNGSMSKAVVPDLVRSIATILSCQIMQDQGVTAGANFPFFNEENYIPPSEHDVKQPGDYETIMYKYVRKVFEVGQFPAECIAISLIYINRLIALTGLAMTKSNWKPIWVTALVLAQKVWDDTPLINADFTILYPGMTVEILNFLEKEFLDCLQFKLMVTPSLYAQYYFELRFMSDERELQAAPVKRSKNRRIEQREYLADIYHSHKKEFPEDMSVTIDMLRLRPKRRIVC